MSTEQQSIEQQVWDKAKPMKGRNPDKVRQDPYGNQIHRREYGKDTPHGWTVDHIKPVSRGGSKDIRNLQALQTSVNREKGNSLAKRSRHNQ